MKATAFTPVLHCRKSGCAKSLPDARQPCRRFVSALLTTGCSSRNICTETQQSTPTTEVVTINLRSRDLRTGGLAFIAPSAVTGQESAHNLVAYLPYHSRSVFRLAKTAFFPYMPRCAKPSNTVMLSD